jgi:hypothetical protein
MSCHKICQNKISDVTKMSKRALSSLLTNNRAETTRPMARFKMKRGGQIYLKVVKILI